MKRRERTVVVLILVAVALLLRWAFVATGTVQHPLRADAGQYAQYAQNLVQHGVYSLDTNAPPRPDSFRSPAYAWFLAGCRWLAGAEWQKLALALQVALGALLVPLVYRLARSWLPFPAAALAAALTALSPHLVVATTYVLTETLVGFLLLSGLCLFVAVFRLPTLWRAVAAGLCLGATALANEAFLPVALVLSMVLWRRLGRGSALPFLLVALPPVLGWGFRNHTTELARHGSERLVASISHGSYPGMVYSDPRLVGFPYREDPEQPGFGASAERLRAVLLERVAADPLRYASWYLLEKPLWLWRWDLVQGRDVYVYEVANPLFERQAAAGLVHAGMRWLHLPLMLLAAGSAFVLVLRWRSASPIGASLAVTAIAATLAFVPVIPDPRYLQPVRPVLFVLASAPLGALLGWLPRRSARAAPAVSSPAASAHSSVG